MSDFSWLYDWPLHIPNLLPGLWTAIYIAVVACAVGYALGFFLAVMTEAPIRVVRYVAVVIVETGRGLPILVLMYLAYQGLPQVGVVLDPVPSATAALTWSAAAYSTEMIRAGLASVPRGQFEAAAAVSLSRADTYRFVVIPQAARVSIPPLVNLAITIFQATSLATVITVSEIMQHAYLYGSINFQYMSVYFAAAMLYLSITLPGAILTGFLEKRLGSTTKAARRMSMRKLVTSKNPPAYKAPAGPSPHARTTGETS